MGLPFNSTRGNITIVKGAFLSSYRCAYHVPLLPLVILTPLLATGLSSRLFSTPSIHVPSLFNLSEILPVSTTIDAIGISLEGFILIISPSGFVASLQKLLQNKPT